MGATQSAVGGAVETAVETATTAAAAAGEAVAEAAAEAAAEVVKQPNIPQWHEALIVVLVALLSALASEALSWYFIYRKEDHQRLRASLKRLGRMYEKRQREVRAESLSNPAAAGAGPKKPDKKLASLEKSLRGGQQEMTVSAMKMNLLIGVVTSVVFFSVQRRWYGVVMAKLPFRPYKLVQNISHRGLPGEDSTDASFTFLYVLSNMAIRGSVQKLCGSGPLRVLEELSNPLLKDEEQ